MVKCLLFDLDGVLIDACDIHADAFRMALQQVTGIEMTPEEHERDYNGLSTRAKLAKMGLPDEVQTKVFLVKQSITWSLLPQRCASSDRLVKTFETLFAKGYKVGCVSNCIRLTVEGVLERLAILPFFDVVISSGHVENPKPAPDMYRLAMERLGVTPEETMIFEDSYIGLQAAVASGAHVHRVSSPNDITAEYVLSAKPNLTQHLNIVIPMAGNGSRFAQVGYKDPKPFIPVFGKPMISWVVQNLGVDARYTFVIRKEFEETYAARDYLRTIAPDCQTVSIDKTTEGAACTVLLTEEHIDNDNPLIIINSDQYIEFEGCPTAFKFIFDFLYSPSEKHLDGKISTFDGKGHPKWSYAKLGDDGIVTEVREKDPFSEHATTGLYMWRRGSDFVRYAKQMIQKNIRVNNEFYVVPVFNEAIGDGKRIGICSCTRMWGIGVPEDLDYFLQNYR